MYTPIGWQSGIGKAKSGPFSNYEGQFFYILPPVAPQWHKEGGLVNSNEDTNTGGIGKIWEELGAIVARRAGMIVISTLLLTVLLILPILFMAPDRQASGEPGGEVFDIMEKIDEKMPPANMYSAFILEADSGDVLTQEVLWEFYQNEIELRNSEFGSTYLVSRYDVELNTWIPGIYTVADAVEIFLRNSFGIGL